MATPSYAATIRPRIQAGQLLLGILLVTILGLSIALAWTAFNANPAMSEAQASELNHHLAGCILILMAVMAFHGEIYDSRTRYLWPLLFIALGLFLAAWSDAEIWPRGPLSWSWLIDHDAEARQHKIYAILLISIGTIELFRARGRLAPFVHRWALPALAVCGAWLLTMHAHGGTSGLPAGWTPSQPVALAASDATTTVPSHHDHEHMQHASVPSGPSHHEHVMSATMLKIQREHLWMTITGMIFAMSKLLADSGTSLSRYMRCVWPSAMALLGILLVLYRE
jgi:hypothetical protein